MEIEELRSLRGAIDSIDRQILGLVVARAKLALAVGDLKRRHQLPIYDPERERALLDDLAICAEPPLDAVAVRRVFEAVVGESRRLQEQASTSD